MRRAGLSALALSVLAWLAIVPVVSGEELRGIPSVIDGDTIEVHSTRVRLFGIDAPESGQTGDRDGKSWMCGQQAAMALDGLINHRPVRCVKKDTDRYGRTVAVCYLGSLDLCAEMVRLGWAVAYRKYSLDYVPQEEDAHSNKRGLWSGTFAAPWDWRQAIRGDGFRPSGRSAGRSSISTSQVAHPGRLIKGNISSKGERIYHVPGGRCYGATRIDEDQGERWFSSEQEAVAAGWRRSRW
jgi:endonuclease YncB( thermonuclease family)